MRPSTIRLLQTSLWGTTAALMLLVPAPAGAQDGTWVALSNPAGSPGPRREFAAVYDVTNQRYLIFGGFNGDGLYTYILFNEVWALSLNGTPAWSQLSPAGPTPGPRHSPQWGYDAARNRLLLFGGYGSHYPGDPWAYLNDVWELSLDGTPTWNEILPAGPAPAGRLAGAAVFDPMRQRFVGFGGTVGMPVDTWVLNLQGAANWQSLPVDTVGPPGTTRPNGGYGMTSVYDARGDRMLIFGGSTSPSYYGATNEVWELRLRGLPEWNQVLTTGTPPVPRRSGTAIFDALRNRMVIYGGFDAVPYQDTFLGDTWALSFDGTPAWTELHPAGTIPTQRDVTAAVYDPVNDRMVMFGGWSGTTMLGDTQFLEWGGEGAGATLTADASATSSAAHLEWDVAGATGPHAAVYRRAPGGKWTALAVAEVGLDGRLVYDDATVQAGQQYGYMMVVGSERGETFGGAIDVAVPSPVGIVPTPAPEFALHRVAPNPAVDRTTVSFTLPSAEPATLELIDVGGRRVLEHAVGVQGPGVHRVELRTEGRVPAGMYFVRLRQSGRIAASRVVVTGGR